jgi:hypothetical protein
VIGEHGWRQRHRRRERSAASAEEHRHRGAGEVDRDQIVAAIAVEISGLDPRRMVGTGSTCGPKGVCGAAAAQSEVERRIDARPIDARTKLLHFMSDS